MKQAEIEQFECIPHIGVYMLNKLSLQPPPPPPFLQAQAIARNAQQFVRENLLPKDIFCYTARLLTVSA